MRTFYIGRNSDNDVVYNVSEVSGRHAEITVGDNGQIVFTDYSTNGSYVNGNPVHHASQVVMYGDEIVFPGNIRFDWNLISGYVQVQPQPVNNDYANWQGNANNGGYNNVSGGNAPMPPSESDTLSFSLTFKEGLSSGFRNSLRLFAIILLSALTSWIPYINIGVFTALTTLPAQWAKGEAVNPLSIFDSRYRRPIGNFLLSMFLVTITTGLGMIFYCIPGIVISYSWSLTSLFVVENDLNPIDAISASNKCTYGSKWTMFAINLVYVLCISVVVAIFVGIGYMIISNYSFSDMDEALVPILILALFLMIFMVIASSVGIGIKGSMWRQLKSRAALAE